MTPMRTPSSEATAIHSAISHYHRGFVRSLDSKRNHRPEGLQHAQVRLGIPWRKRWQLSKLKQDRIEVVRWS
jgi:hypothetical protein